MFVDDSAGNCNSVARSVPGLKVYKCNPSGLTKLDCDLIVKHFMNRSREIDDSYMLNDVSMLNVTHDGSEASFAIGNTPRPARTSMLLSYTPGSCVGSEGALNVRRNARILKGGSTCVPYKEDILGVTARNQSVSAYVPMVMASARKCEVVAPRHDSSKTPPVSSMVKSRRPDASTLPFSSLRKTNNSCEIPVAKGSNANARPMSPGPSHLRSISPSFGAKHVVSRTQTQLRRDTPGRSTSPSSGAEHVVSRIQTSRPYHQDLGATVKPNARLARSPRMVPPQEVRSPPTPKEPPSFGQPTVSHPPIASQAPVSKTAKYAFVAAAPKDSVKSSLASTTTSRLGGA